MSEYHHIKTKSTKQIEREDGPNNLNVFCVACARQGSLRVSISLDLLNLDT